ncbi:hypothetical protein [Plantactinospora sp. GCM10030261]|uniref:hypothetical protein n=1 Tax=Plantactinospora sp. GCM10030261 TaxID=3273420 RepID=UPI0036103EBE
MKSWQPIVGAAAAVLAAAFWAVGLTELQALTEPLGPWSERLASNNTYWARDLRFMAIVAALAGVVLGTGGDRRVATLAAPAATVWVVVDLVLDRLDVDGTATTVGLASGAALVMLAAIGTAHRWPAGSTPAVLIVVAAVTAATAPVAMAIESPTYTEPELTPAAVAVAGLLAVLAIGCAVAAAPERRRIRWAAAGLLTGAAAAGIALGRTQPPGGRLLGMLLLAIVLLVGVLVLTRPAADGRPDLRRLALLGVASLGYPILLHVLVIAMAVTSAGAGFTRLAGNPAINAADSDVLLSLAGVGTGLVYGLLLVGLSGRPAGSVGVRSTDPAPSAIWR